MEASLSGKCALVIGGTRGIGAAISRTLARSGADVAMLYASRANEADALVQELRDRGTNALAIGCDVACTDALEAAMDSALAHLGAFDILVCCAGLTIVGAMDGYADDAFDRVYSVNVRAPFLAARKAARTMARNGRIVMIGSSVSARVPGGGATLYASSKAALDGMVRGLARDLAEREITANVVHPGPMATERNSGGGDRGQIANGPLALQRYGAPDEVAELVLYLCSPQGGYVTGQRLFVDGGWTA